MTVDIRFALLLWYFAAVPFILGKLILYRRELPEARTAQLYLLGLMGEFALYQLIALPLQWLGKSLDTVTLVFTAAVLAALAADLLLWKKDLPVTACGKKLVREPLFWIFAAFLLYQLWHIICWKALNYSDDVTYMTMVSDMAYTGEMYAGDDEKYLFTSYYPFVAMIARTTGMKALVLTKTVIASIYLVLFYLIWGVFGAAIFPGDAKKQSLFLFFLAIATEASGYSQYTLSKRILLYTWNGKAALYVVTLSYLFYLIWRYFQTKPDRRQMAILCMVLVAAAGNSMMGCMMAPAMVGTMGFVETVIRREKGPLLQAILVCIPAAFFLLVVAAYMIGVIPAPFA